MPEVINLVAFHVPFLLAIRIATSMIATLLQHPEQSLGYYLYKLIKINIITLVESLYLLPNRRSLIPKQISPSAQIVDNKP